MELFNIFLNFRNRRRALTNQFSLHSEHHTLSQKSSFLLKLPTELRTQIWDDVIGPNKIHILSCYDSSKKRYGPCAYENEDWGRVCYRGCWRKCPLKNFEVSREYVLITADWDFYGKKVAKVGCAGLLGTCRALYMEVLDVLLKRTFFFTDLPSILVFYSSLPVSHLNRIRSLHLDIRGSHYRIESDPIHGLPRHMRKKRYAIPSVTGPHGKKIKNPSTWHCVCAAIAQMSGLKTLVVELEAESFRTGRLWDDEHGRGGKERELYVGIEEKILKPLISVAAKIEKSEVVADWGVTQGYRDRGVVVRLRS